jgi:hypothetical protein
MGQEVSGEDRRPTRSRRRQRALNDEISLQRRFSLRGRPLPRQELHQITPRDGPAPIRYAVTAATPLMCRTVSVAATSVPLNHTRCGGCCRRNVSSQDVCVINCRSARAFGRMP